jgi:hypothetical protein
VVNTQRAHPSIARRSSLTPNREYIMKKKVAVLVSLAAAAVLCGHLSPAAAAPKAAAAAPAAKKYQATVYVAGHGGHFAKADVTIDPANAAQPLKVNGLDKVDIGTPESHKFHDGRIDAKDANLMFWSTYALDKEGKLHFGKSDLKSGKVIKDVAFAPDARAPMKAGPAYCASGQSKSAFLPVFMGSEGYVDVVDKATLQRKQRMFVSDLGFKEGSYQFVHGTNSNDMKTFLIAVALKGDDGKMNGKQELVLVDLPSLEKGKFKELARTTLAGEPGKTITFRQYFTADDTLVYQSAGDRMWVIDAKTLKIVDEKMTKPDFGENHDVQPTPDGRYAILTLRTEATGCDDKGNPIVPEKKVTDGAIALYDAQAKKLVGKAESTCFACHKDMGKGDKSAVLCGLATAFKK